MAEIEVKVTDRYQTYTASVGKVRASCTSGAEHAVSKLATKLLGKLQRFTVSPVDARGPGGAQWWRIDVDETQACRVCGCTWHAACECGCHWVEADLCSSCVGKARPQ